MIILILFLILFLILIITIFNFFQLIINFLGAPFVPSDKKAIYTIIKFIEKYKKRNIADLGSGDGRVAIELAKYGASVEGYELNPILILLSRFFARRSQLKGDVYFHQQNFWNVNLSKFNIVVIYGLPSIMKKLENKLKGELRPGSKIISNKFKLFNFKLIRKENDVYLYIV